MTRIHFDGQPDVCSRMRALFQPTSTLQQKPEYAKPVAKKFRWSRLQAKAERMVWKIRRAA